MADSDQPPQSSSRRTAATAKQPPAPHRHSMHSYQPYHPQTTTERDYYRHQHYHGGSRPSNHGNNRNNHYVHHNDSMDDSENGGNHNDPLMNGPYHYQQPYHPPATAAAAAAAAASATTTSSAAEVLAAQQDIGNTDAAAIKAKIKRLCRHPGCNRVIKSQGHCQRHGAKAKRCRVAGCDKQAQGTHDGMCKRHWKAIHFPETKKTEVDLPTPEGESVYDQILPQSIAYRPPLSGRSYKNMTLSARADAWNPVAAEPGSIMPLVTFLREGGKHKAAGWHRNSERKARGMPLIASLSTQLEPWERQLALVEILLLSGGTPFADFKDLAHAWGREPGFHTPLATAVCERRGEVERKRRNDTGRKLTAEEKAAWKASLQARMQQQQQQQQQQLHQKRQKTERHHSNEDRDDSNAGSSHHSDNHNHEDYEPEAQAYGGHNEDSKADDDDDDAEYDENGHDYAHQSAV